MPRVVRAAEPPEVQPPPIETTTGAGDADAEEPPRRLVKWNEYDWGVTTFRFGGGILLDGSAYAQDEASKEQVSMEPDVGVRDFRLLFKGVVKTERPFSWTLGYMYDGADKEWRFRQTGVQIGFPELHGNLFVGRTKEGYSMVKVMVGYHGWTMERSPGLDAFIPILADGLKWSGYHPGPRVFYQIGAYADRVSEDEKFSTSDHQFVTRFGFQPVLAGDRLLHVAVMARYSDPDNETVQERARPEAYLAPYFLDTGKFAAERARTMGFEVYERTGPWLFGTEYNWQGVDASDGRTPLFHAGDAVAVWLITGEVRPYNAPGAYFGAVSPRRTVFQGGPGAWEAVFHVSYSDFDSQGFTGGRFWRFTPMVNWHLSDNLRLECGYGYGVLDRFDLEGRTQFFQVRIQATL